MLRAVTENVLLEIQKTFDFYRSTAASDRLDRVMLCGGAARVHGFAGALADRFGLPVEPLNPFRRIAFDAARVGRGRRRSGLHGGGGRGARTATGR